VLSTNASLTPTPSGGIPVETIAGRYFPEVNDGNGGMVLITDGGPGWCLHAYVSMAADMEHFVAAKQPCLSTHPPAGGAPGDWAQIQIAFVPSSNGSITSVGYALWASTAAAVPAAPDIHRSGETQPNGKEQARHIHSNDVPGYTMTLFDVQVVEYDTN
jgi:hypothetical protein